MSIKPATLSQTDDGTPYAPVYDDVYHSRAGAIAQARHVFLGGNALPERWAGRDCFVIAETGFGLGLNFLTTWARWAEQPDTDRCQRLHFVSVEKHPLLTADLTRLLQPYTTELPAALTTALIEQWPTLTAGLHRLEFAEGRVVLTLALGDAETMLSQIAACADAIYLDGFSPSKNPEIWSERVCQGIARLSGAGTTLATWSVNGEVRRRLEAVGFDLQRRAGFAQKREMLTGVFRERRPHPHPALNTGHALIIGAGLAGTATAERLAARGWHCTVIDADAIATGASGNRAGVLRPQPAADDNPLSRLTRAGFLSTLLRLRQLHDQGLAVDWNACGVLHLAHDGEQQTAMQKTVSTLGWPEDLLSWLPQQAASSRAGLTLSEGGWWFAGGGWVNPQHYCQQLLTASGATLITDTPVERLHADGSQWLAVATNGQTIARGDIVVLANASDALRLAAPFSRALPLRPARGQTTVIAAPPAVAPQTVVCRSGYWTPAIAGQSTCGASFVVDDTDLTIRTSEHAANLAVVRGMLADPAAQGTLPTADDRTLGGKVGLRPIVPDRLPLVGALPACVPVPEPTTKDTRLSRRRVPGLYVNSGYGARGILLATLCAELLASQIAGEPLPLTKDLVRAIDPLRYAYE